MNTGDLTMRAMIRDTYRSPDKLELSDIDTPHVGPDDVLLRVHAAGVDQGAWHLVTGLPYPVRLAGYGLRRPKARVPGREVAGRVEAVGANVTRFKPGDEVFGVCDGAFAEYALAREKGLAPKPANVTFEQAAVVPVSACAALLGLRDRGEIAQGQRVLVIGASGGVGTFAVQLAKHFGAHVTGVCSTSKVDLVRSLGADEVVDYTREDFADGSHRYDLILDTGGNSPLKKLRRALTPRGTLVIVGSETGGRWLGGADRALRAMLLSPFVGQRLRPLLSSERAEDLELLRELIEAGKITPALDRTYPLGEVPEAIRYLRDGQARGKVAVTI
jgi:NADPH:quinone reductase-like Zn-dependent oxidoreductase